MKLFYISGPKKNVTSGYWLYNQLQEDFDAVKALYIRENDVISPWRQRFNMFKVIFITLFTANKDDLILVYDNDTTGIYLGLLLHIFRPKLFVHKINAMANTKGQLYSTFKKFFVRMAYKNIVTTVNNEDIANLYASFLNLPKRHFVPIPDSISDFGNKILKIANMSDEGYVFMGGATHRDYELFVEVARHLPQYQFVAVTFERYKHYFDNATKNVVVLYNLKEDDFYQKIANSSMVYVPLTNDMQGGQLVVMQGALLKKPIITTDTMAIHSYFSDTSAFFLGIGDLNKSIKVISTLMENKVLREEFGNKAFKDVSRFTTEAIYEQYKEKLFSIKL